MNKAGDLVTNENCRQPVMNEKGRQICTSLGRAIIISTGTPLYCELGGIVKP